jgi:hypothetical protein
MRIFRNLFALAGLLVGSMLGLVAAHGPRLIR